MSEITLKDVEEVFKNKKDTPMCVHRILGELGFNYITDNRVKRLHDRLKTLRQRRVNGVIAVRQDRCRSLERIHKYYKMVDTEGDYYYTRTKHKEVSKMKIKLDKNTEAYKMLKHLIDNYPTITFCHHDITKILQGNPKNLKSKEYRQAGSLLDQLSKKKLIIKRNHSPCLHSDRRHVMWGLHKENIKQMHVFGEDIKVIPAKPKEEKKMTEKTQTNEHEKIKLSLEILQSNLSYSSKSKLMKNLWNE